MVVRVQRYPVFSSPFDNLSGFEREIDDMFGNLLEGVAKPQVRTYPALDMAEYENESVVVAEMPGVRKEDVRVSVQNDVLTISGVRKGHTQSTGTEWLRNEIRTGEFSRSIRLPHAVNQGTIGAELTNGILRITLPKAEEAKSREIQIK